MQVMKEPKTTGQSPLEAEAGKLPAQADPAPVQPLTPEEQMAQFEKEFKENDWGHQPC